MMHLQLNLPPVKAAKVVLGVLVVKAAKVALDVKAAQAQTAAEANSHFKTQ